jgi:class 3 adenylate cyclase/tetratricopeptide (TPR) repeat protein
MRCPRCATELPESAKFCLECGQPLGATPAAAASFASPAAYTPRHLADKILTSRSALEGERKQVTVLFCDLANSTPMAERLGPERMHALLNGFFELALGEVHRYEGTINQFLGDGFMALFGAPLAHEDDARRTVLAAIAIRRALRDRGSYMGGSDLAVRIGVNTGLVVVGSIGVDLRMDYTAVGDTTNVAARLQQMAEPGDILISEATARLVRSEARLVPAGALTVKGKSEPVTAYKVLGPAPRRSALERAGERAFGRFVGRERELRTLGEVLAGAQQCQGRLLRIVGEAGSGKSRLLYEFRRTLGDLDLTLLEGRGRSYGSALPYLPITDLVRAQCGVADADTPEVVGDKVRATLSSLGLDADARAPYPLQLLGMKEGASALEAMSPEAAKAGTIETVLDMLRAASRRRPLIIVVEDLHWIDPPSEELLGALVSGLAHEPILLVLTSRPEYEPPWRAPACVTDIALQPLSAEDSLTVVHAMLARAQVADAMVDVILDKADGNPLFLEELTRAVTEAGAGGALAVPDTLHGVLMARVDRLPELQKRLLQTASVLGREFPLRLLEAVWDGAGAAAVHLAELARQEFLHEQPLAEETSYAFNHALMQEVAYESLLTASRETLHAAAARALETLYAGRLEQVYDRLAYHYARTPDAERAVEYLTRIAERAGRAYANAEALLALEEAHTHAARLEPAAAERVRLDLVLRRSETLFLMGRFKDSLDLLVANEGPMAATGQPALLCQYWFRLASTYGVLGDGARAAAYAQRAIDAASRCHDAETTGKAHGILAREAFWTGQMRVGLEHGRRAVQLLQPTPERYWLGMAYWTMAMNYALGGDFDSALDCAASAQAVADRLGERRLAANAAWTSGWVHALRGDWAAGIEAGRRAVATAPEGVSRALAVGFLGNTHVEAGNGAEALPLLTEAIAAFASFSFPQLEGWFTIFKGHALLLRGDLDEAERHVRAGLAIVNASGFSPAAGAAARLLSAIALARGDTAAARQHATEALRMLEATGARFEIGRAYAGLARIEQARGDRAAAREHWQQAHRLFKELRVPRHLAALEADAGAAGVMLAVS